MRSHLLLVPVVAVASVAAPAQAEVYLTAQQAQKLLFPTATFTQDFFELSTQQYILIRDTADGPIWTDNMRVWKVSTGGWFIVDVVKGRGDTLFYAIGINAEGAVTGIEIMECDSNYAQVRNPAWRRQFVGLKRGQMMYSRVQNISGTSLSTRHIMEGVERTLITHDLIIKHRR